VTARQARGIAPLVAMGRSQMHRPDDVRPPPPPKAARKIKEPWRLAMQAKLETDNAKTRYAKRQQTVEWLFGIIKSVMGFRRFHLCSLRNLAREWLLISLAYNCRRLHRLPAA